MISISTLMAENLNIQCLTQYHNTLITTIIIAATSCTISIGILRDRYENHVLGAHYYLV